MASAGNARLAAGDAVWRQAQTAAAGVAANLRNQQTAKRQAWLGGIRPAKRCAGGINEANHRRKR